jgi:hypothetical protein
MWAGTELMAVERKNQFHLVPVETMDPVEGISSSRGNESVLPELRAAVDED